MKLGIACKFAAAVEGVERRRCLGGGGRRGEARKKGRVDLQLRRESQPVTDRQTNLTALSFSSSLTGSFSLVRCTFLHLPLFPLLLSRPGKHARALFCTGLLCVPSLRLMQTTRPNSMPHFHRAVRSSSEVGRTG